MYDMVSNRDSVRNVYSSPVSSDSRSCLLLACVFRFKKLAVSSVAVEEEDDGTVPFVDLVVGLHGVSLEVYAEALGHFELIDEHVVDGLGSFLRQAQVIGWIGCLDVGISCDNEVDVWVCGKEVGDALEVFLLCVGDVVAVDVEGDGGLEGFAESNFFVDFRHHHVGIVEFFVFVACHLCESGKDV